MFRTNPFYSEHGVMLWAERKHHVLLEGFDINSESPRNLYES